VDASPVVLTPPPVELSAEVAQRTEVHPAHELLRQRTVEPLELPSTSGIVRPPVDHRDAPSGAVVTELPRDEAAPVVDVEGLGSAAAFERPPEIVGGLAGSLPPIRACHHEEAGTIVQDGVDVDVPSDPGDPELVDVHLPEGVHVTALEPFEWLRLLDDPDHEPVLPQEAVDRARADAYPSPRQQGVDPKGTPRGMAAPQLEDPVGEIAVDPVGAVVRASRVVPEPLDAFLSVVSTPTAKGALGDPEDPANLRGANSLLDVLFDDL